MQGADRINEIPNTGIKLKEKGIGRAALAFSVKRGKNSDNSIPRNDLLKIGIIPANDEMLVRNADHAMQNIFSAISSVKNYVVLFRRLFERRYNYHIATGFKKRLHTYALGNRRYTAFFGKLSFDFA